MESSIPSTSNHKGLGVVALVGIPLLTTLVGITLGAAYFIVASGVLSEHSKPAVRAVLASASARETCLFLAYIFLSIWLLVMFRRKREAFAAGFSQPTLVVSLFALGIGAFLAMAQTVFLTYVSAPFHPYVDKSYWNFALALAASGMAAPFAEELWFRGAILGWLCQRVDNGKAIAICALLFGVTHIGSPLLSRNSSLWIVPVIASLLGFANARFVLRTKSLWPGIIVHSTFNATVTVYYFIVGLYLFLGSAITVHDGMVAFRAKDYGKAMAIWRPLAEHGDGVAQIGVGGMYVAALGVPRNYQESIRWLSMAAAQSNANGEFDLAQIYTHAEGVPRDYPKAAALYLSAARHGHSEAQLQLGLLYSKGAGVPMNLPHAYMWWSLAAEKGHKVSAHNASIARGKMSAAELKEAELMLVRCKLSAYKDCG